MLDHKAVVLDKNAVNHQPKDLLFRVERRLLEGIVKLAAGWIAGATWVRYEAAMTNSTKSLYTGHRFPPELISYTVWLYFRFPLSLRMVEEMLAFRGIEVSHETIRQWALKFGQEFANIIRRRLPRPGDKWHLDLRHEVA